MGFLLCLWSKDNNSFTGKGLYSLLAGIVVDNYAVEVGFGQVCVEISLMFSLHYLALRVLLSERFLLQIRIQLIMNLKGILGIKREIPKHVDSQSLRHGDRMIVCFEFVCFCQVLTHYFTLLYSPLHDLLFESQSSPSQDVRYADEQKSHTCRSLPRNLSHTTKKPWIYTRIHSFDDGGHGPGCPPILTSNSQMTRPFFPLSLSPVI
ncbi:hypothetical protein GGR50DRAFT_684062 [Xylaria sp. CBS 124048]|nr:hypothetical protein GGR50DRAFT_684062 [Xylaria sp. CBS 124048]